MVIGGVRPVSWFVCLVLCLLLIGWLLVAGPNMGDGTDDGTASGGGTQGGIAKRESTDGDTATGGGAKDGTATGGRADGGTSTRTKNTRGIEEEITLVLENMKNLITLLDGILKETADKGKPCNTKTCRQAEAKLETLRKKMARLTKPIKVCNTGGCQQAADLIKKTWNPAADPCDDFYEFSCGGLLKQELPDVKYAVIGPNAELTKMYRNRTLGLVVEDVQNDDLKPIKAKKILYTACMDTDTIDAQGVQPIEEFFKANNLTLPYRTPIDFWGEVARYSSLGLTSVFRIYRMFGAKYVTISNGLSPSDLRALSNQTRRLLPFLEHNMSQEIDNRIQELSQNLTDIRKRKDYKPWSLHDPRISLGDLIRPFPDRFRMKMPWLINKAVELAGVNLTLTEKDGMFAFHASYVGVYAKVLDTAPDEVLLSALALKAIKDLSEFTSLRDKNMSLETRSKMCATGMGYAQSRMYVDRYLPKDWNIKHNLHELSRLLGLQIQLLFAHTPWMDEATKAVAIKKASAMTYDHAYPDWILNDTALNLHYSKIKVNEKTALVNEVSVSKAKFANDMELVLSNSQSAWDPETMWRMSAVNIWFLNAFQVRFVFILPPYYRHDVIRALNFGGIGFIIGHEIVHSFDSKGHNIDDKCVHRDWWTNKSREGFIEGTQCIIDQYRNYRIPVTNTPVNAHRSLKETIADIGGLKVAYLAYRNWVEYEGEEEATLPDIDLTPSQLFFLNFATVWCKKGSYAYTKRWSARNRGTYAGERARVIGALQGYKGFADAFNCPRGSKMNPRPQCPFY